LTVVLVHSALSPSPLEFCALVELPPQFLQQHPTLFAQEFQALLLLTQDFQPFVAHSLRPERAAKDADREDHGRHSHNHAEASENEQSCAAHPYLSLTTHSTSMAPPYLSRDERTSARWPFFLAVWLGFLVPRSPGPFPCSLPVQPPKPSIS
jgi:hypothetical protein